VLGVENVVSAALRHEVKTFVTISTDKAVKPVNVMGMTKALQERIVLNANLSRLNKGTVFTCVRYGNVLRSRGSVVPFFRRQLSLGQMLTVTDERMTRFLLTLNDAINLVLYAAENASPGDTFVRKAPSALILDIASVLAAEYSRPLEYRVIGILPGEKLNEILVSEEEMGRTEDLGDYYKIHPWWVKNRPQALNQEYSSFDELVGVEVVKQLISRADREFELMELQDGELSKV
jgi:UDP-glucose 4-epimerase